MLEVADIGSVCTSTMCQEKRTRKVLWEGVFASSLVARVSKTSVELDVGVYRRPHEGDDVFILEMGHLGIGKGAER